MPEKYKAQLIICQLVILLYQIAVMILLIVHVKRQPRISNSLKALNQEKMKYFFMWMPFCLLVACLCVYNIYLAELMDLFQSWWLIKLAKVEDFYPCTDDSLEINLKLFEKDYEKNAKIYYLLIMTCNIVLIVSSVAHFAAHYSMMMRWFTENPTDGTKIARSI